MKNLKSKPRDLAGLSQFKIPIQKIKDLQELKVSGSQSLYFREFPNDCENLVFLIHGMGGDSRYLTMLASKLQESGQFSVVTPDLPFHGPKGNQKEVSLNDSHYIVHYIDTLLNHFKNKSSFKNLFLLGHSLGASVVLKWLESQVDPSAVIPVKEVMLVTPYLSSPYNVEGEYFSEWIQRENDSFHLKIDPKIRLGTEVEIYHKSYLEACIPAFLDVPTLLEKIDHFTLIASKADPIISADKIEKEFKNINRVNLKIEEDLSHLGVLTSPLESEKIRDIFLSRLFA